MNEGVSCLQTHTLLQGRVFDGGGMLSTVLAWGRWVPPGVGGYGSRADLGTGPGWHCLSTTCKRGRERGHCACLPSGAWLMGTGFSSPGLSLPTSDAAGCPGLHVESLQGLALQ